MENELLEIVLGVEDLLGLGKLQVEVLQRSCTLTKGIEDRFNTQNICFRLIFTEENHDIGKLGLYERHHEVVEDEGQSILEVHFIVQVDYAVH